MVWMSRCTVKVLMFVCKLYVEVCDQLIFRQSQLKIQKGNGFFIELKGKFNVEGVSYSNLLRTLGVLLYHVSKIRKTSSIHRNHSKGLNSCVSRINRLLFRPLKWSHIWEQILYKQQSLIFGV